mmetsp:Transcript_15275/g.37490  ORF Transcript_15275/g.37490 Transcript_15275/m.37490 type:complete len:192 (-) Transcript_15275:51-626(-)
MAASTPVSDSGSAGTGKEGERAAARHSRSCTPCHLLLLSSSTIIVLGAVAAQHLLSRPRTNGIPGHLLGNPAVFDPQLLNPRTAKSLLETIKSIASFPTNAQDLKFYNTTHEHIGEATPVDEHGRCPNPYLIPSSDGNSCLLAGRIDIARHFLRTRVFSRSVHTSSTSRSNSPAPTRKSPLISCPVRATRG